jgi:hypothetical protein
VSVAGIYFDLFFRGQHLVLGGNQYQVTGEFLFRQIPVDFIDVIALIKNNH